MKKLISLFTSFVVLLNIYSPVFADPKGDPLDVNLHPGYTDLLRAAFEAQERDKRKSDYPCKWEKEPNFWFWSDDYRKVVVYNMPLLADTERTDNFFRSSADALLKARESASRAEGIARRTGEEVLKVFKGLLVKKLTNTPEIRTIADFLGTDERIAIDSFICAVGMTCFSRIAHAVSLIAIFSNVLNTLSPIAGILTAGALDALCYFTTKSALEYEKIKNYAIALSTVFQIILNRPSNVLDSNVLVTAIDERNFYSIFRWTAFRRDDGAWCDFVNIGELRCAPKARDYENGDVVRRYIEIFNEIMRNGELDLVRLDGYINGRPSPLRPLQEARAEETHG